MKHTTEPPTRRQAILAVAACFFALALALAPAPARQRPPAAKAPTAPAAKRLLVISVDGLDARYLREADRHGLKIPTLRRLMAAGAWARAGVVGVYPSVTYPSHATLVTGARPARHGIYGNAVFEPPPDEPSGAWHWFAREIKVDTLWQAAERARLKTALVSWPVSTGAGDWNVPEIWQPGGTREQSRERMREHARPRGLLEEVARADDKLYAAVTDDEGDDMRTRFAEYLLAEKRPDVALVHLFDLDHAAHDYGPFSREALAMLEKSDAYLARLLAAAERAGTLTETAVFVVSDHGFRRLRRMIHANVVLERAGLLKWRQVRNARGEPRRVVGEWRAVAYTSGAYCAVMLRDPEDRDAFWLARTAFMAYEGRGQAGIGQGAGGQGGGQSGGGQGGGGQSGGGQGVLRFVGRAELDQLGADPRAAFALDPREGYSFEPGYAAEPVVETKQRGQHGYLPTPREYRASFIAAGPGLARRDLGEVRMVDIGPTAAALLDLRLRHAEGRALRLR